MFYRPTSFWSWILLVATVIETGTVLVIESVILSILNHNLLPDKATNPELKTIPTFLALLTFGFVYQVLLLYDTLAQRNFIQLGGLCIYAACLGVYTILQIRQIQEAVEELVQIGYIKPTKTPSSTMRSLSIVNSVVTAIYTFIITFSTFKLYHEFQWTIYRQLNADLDMQKRYFTFKIYITLLKFDLFFFLGYMMQLLTITSGLHDPRFLPSVAAVPGIIWTISASTWFMRRENKIGMAIVLISHLGLLAFFVLKFARMYQPSEKERYLPARRGISSYGYIAIILSLATIGLAIKCMTNFDKGLKIHITSQRVAHKLLEDHEMEMSELNVRN